jgi:hypothetical protein
MMPVEEEEEGFWMFDVKSLEFGKTQGGYEFVGYLP